MEFRTALFCTCFVNSDTAVERYRRWLKFNQDKLGELNASKIILIDDGSPLEWLNQLNLPIYDVDVVQMPNKINLPKSIEDDIVIFRFPDNLGRPLLTLIPGWWRSFSFASILGIRYNLDRLIHIESDSYVLSWRMRHWLATVPVWSSPYTPQYWYAETAVQSIPRNAFKVLFRYWELGREYWYKNNLTDISYIPELSLPIPNVDKSWYGDRWGEDWWTDDIPENADYVVNMGSISCAERYTSNNSQKLRNFFRTYLGDYRESKVAKLNNTIEKLNQELAPALQMLKYHNSPAGINQHLCMSAEALA